LRNIGHLDGSSEVIQRCFQEETNPADIRLAAMDAAGRLLACGGQGESALMAAFSDKEEDSELRIGAYNALMACPDQALVDGIKELLQNEEVNQGSH